MVRCNLLLDRTQVKSNMLDKMLAIIGIDDDFWWTSIS